MLRTARLHLVPYRASMVQSHHVAWLNNHENVKYSEQRHLTHTVESQHSYLNEFPPGSYIWLIRSLGTFAAPPTDLGTITAYVDVPNKVANMGILIDQEHRGQGAAKEAWLRVEEFLKTIGIRKIECGCMSVNVGMAKLAQAVGLRVEGLRPEHFEWGGRRVAMTHYGKLI